MPDWKAMYLSLMRDTEKAIRILEEGQRKCEELYLQDPGPSLRVLDPSGDKGPDSGEAPFSSEKEKSPPPEGKADAEGGRMRGREDPLPASGRPAPSLGAGHEGPQDPRHRADGHGLKVNAPGTGHHGVEDPLAAEDHVLHAGDGLNVHGAGGVHGG